MTGDRDEPPSPTQGPRATGWARPDARAALLGAGLALVSTLLLPLHLGGASGLVIGVGFAGAGIALGGASMAVGAGRLLPQHARRLRYWAVLGASGFVVSGLGLAADLADFPIIVSEVLAILAVTAWWSAIAGNSLSSEAVAAETGPLNGRVFGYLSLGCAVVALAALLSQFVWQPPPGAVPARLAYVLWGPWGLVLATRLARQTPPD